MLRRADLLEIGLGREALKHRVRHGRMHELHPGVYALGHRAISRKAEFPAATWWCGGDAALADESACAFYRWVTEDADHPPPVPRRRSASAHGPASSCIRRAASPARTS